MDCLVWSVSSEYFVHLLTLLAQLALILSVWLQFPLICCHYSGLSNPKMVSHPLMPHQNAAILCVWFRWHKTRVTNRDAVTCSLGSKLLLLSMFLWHSIHILHSSWVPSLIDCVIRGRSFHRVLLKQSSWWGLHSKLRKIPIICPIILNQACVLARWWRIALICLVISTWLIFFLRVASTSLWTYMYSRKRVKVYLLALSKISRLWFIHLDWSNLTKAVMIIRPQFIVDLVVQVHLVVIFPLLLFYLSDVWVTIFV